MVKFEVGWLNMRIGKRVNILFSNRGISLRAVMGVITMFYGFYFPEHLAICLPSGALLLGSTTIDHRGGV